MKLLVCLLTGHRFSPWRLSTLHHRNRVVTDLGVRTCTCCHRRQVARLKTVY